MITGELWNVDLWFFDKKTISEAEKYCDKISHIVNHEQKERIANIKKELIARELYSFDKYKSLDVYNAVLKNNVSNIDEFFAMFN